MWQLIASLLFASWAIPLAGQNDGSRTTFRTHSNLVLLPTRVQTRNGETVYGLKAEQFIVEDNDLRRSIHLDEDEDIPPGLSLVVAIQCSRSASFEFGKLAGLGTMIEAITGDSPHEAAVVSYGDEPTLLGDFSSSPDTLQLNLSKLRECPDYGAATLDTVDFATRLLKDRHNNYRRAILLIGETRDHGSQAKLQDVVSSLGVTNTVIYSVAFSPSRDEVIAQLRSSNEGVPEESVPRRDLQPPTRPPISSTPESAAAGDKATKQPPTLELPPLLLLIINALRKNAASELAALSGGEYINFTTQKGFDAGLQRIANRIHNCYMLSFQSPAEANPTVHTLRVSVPDLPDAVIQTRTSYWSGQEKASGQDR